MKDYILSIESSCDDSAIAITRISDCKLIYHAKISQNNYHSNYGGVVPELASRLFANDLPTILKDCINFLLDFFKLESKQDISNYMKAVSVTNEPGLSASLLEGLCLAKAISTSLDLPLIGINHLKGHIYSLLINKTQELDNLAILLVSGGHTMIMETNNYSSVKIISTTLDDSFGECLDKAARMLNLPYPCYPGGPIIEKLANNAINKKLKPIKFSIPMKHHNTLNFSFSGLKNAFRINSLKCHSEDEKEKLALGLQIACISHLEQKCRKYLKNRLKNNETLKHFAIVGGASANISLRDSIKTLCENFNLHLHLSEMEFCQDNAAMIGRAAIAKLEYIQDEGMMCDISPRNTELEYNQKL